MKSSRFTMLLAIAMAAGAATAQVAAPGTALGAGAAVTPATSTAPQSDADFVAKAAVGGLFEVQSSELATTKSQTAAVKTFAQQMIGDHAKANEELKQLATSKNIPVPAQLDEKHAGMMERLSNAEGEKFDNTYGRLQMRAHQEAVALFQTASTSATDPDIKAFAAKTLPVLQHHAQMTQSLPGADKAGKKAGTKDAKGEKVAKDHEAEKATPGASH